MKTFKIIFLILSLSLSLYASNKTTVFALHSYSQEYPWTKSQHNAFIETLQNNKKQVQIHTEHLDTKRVQFSKEYQENFIKYLNNKYSNSKIDLFYVTDDNALLFISQNYDKLFEGAKNAPVFFSGVNNLNMHKILDKKKFIGVYEVKEIAENIELIKQLSPQTRDIYVVGDNSKTYKSIKKIIQKEEKKFDTIEFHYINDQEFSKIESQLPTQPKSFILLTTIGNFKDKNGNTLLVEESIAKMRENPNIILLTMEDAYMYEGVVGGYVTCGTSQGKEAAKLALHYINQGSLDNIHSLLKSPNMYMFDSKELVNSRTYPSAYLLRDATIINENRSFVEKHHSLLLSTFATLIIILSFIIVLGYALFRKNATKNNLKTLENQLNTLKTKLGAKDQFINNIMNFKHVAYWRFNTDDNTLFLSQNLSERLLIDPVIYKDDKDAISYFVHELDKTLYQKNLTEVMNLKKSITFKHKMVDAEKNVFNVQHTIYTEYKGHDFSHTIIGLIEFER